MDAPGPLLASGRDSDIYEYGHGLVLRRARGGRSLEGEAATMAFARDRGYPVPSLVDVVEGGAALVLERVAGPSMMQELSRRPWRMGGLADQLAGLHRRLHAIDAPDHLGAAPGRPGRTLLHLDLHPLNVLMSPAGPVVIDWANAAAGHPPADVALTWVLLESGEIPVPRPLAAVLARFRAAYVRRFLSGFDLADVRSEVPAMVDHKVRDPHMSEKEQEAMRRLAESVRS